MSDLDKAKKENRLLKEVVKNLWEEYKHSQEYALYLIGSISESEYMEAAIEGIKKHNESVNYADIEYAMSILEPLLLLKDDDVTANDIATLLNLDTIKVNELLIENKNEQI